MLAAALLLLQLCVPQCQTEAGNLRNCEITERDTFPYDFSVYIEIISENQSATGHLSVTKSPHQPPGLFSFQHEVLVKDVNCNCTVCSRESLRDSAGVEFICTDLILNANYALLITVNVSQPDVLIHYLYTTDIQEITTETETTAATITCHFAIGTRCRGCVIKWWEFAARNDSQPRGNVNVSRAQNSLTGNGTITGLIPGQTYFLVGYDLESDGTVSDIGVETQLMTKEESTTSEGLTLVWAAIGTILVCASTAIIILLLMYILKRWKTDKVSSKRVSSLRATSPPRTQNILVPATSDSISASNVTQTSIQHPTDSTTLDTIGTPSIPPQSLMTNSSQDDLNTHNNNMGFHNPLSSTQNLFTISNHVHVWQVSLLDFQPRRRFMFPGMLRVSRVNDCIPMQPNLSYETFIKTGSAEYQ